jgi:serine protease
MSKRRVYISLLVFIMSLCLTASVLAQPNPNNVYTGNIGKRPLEYVPGQVVVKFAESVGDNEVEQIVRGLGAQIKLKALKRAFHLLSVPRGQVIKMVQTLKKNPRVVYAHPDYLAYADFTPNDPGYPLQWNLYNSEFGGIEMEGAWEINRGGDSSVIVAVLDTGIAYENFGKYCQAPDLAWTSFVDGYDFVNNDAHPNDDNAHGTHVAGTIAQSTNNATGVAGVAFNISLMPVKVLNANGSGSISTIAAAIRWAADHGAQVINMSLSTAFPSAVLEDAVNYAYSKRVLIVASSGNSSGSSPQYPADYANVIAVGATKYDETLAPYSNKGNEVCAPGGLWVDDNNDGEPDEDLNNDGEPDMVLQNTFDPKSREVCNFGYWWFSGTSMAAPHVSGLAALILSQKPTLSNADVRQIVNSTADPLVNETNSPTICGSGIINAKRALEVAAGFDATPSVSIVAPIDGDAVSDSVTIRINASDLEDPAGTLRVEWKIDGDPDTWDQAVEADYNPGTGYYEADWDTNAVDDGNYTIYARAIDSAGNRAQNSISVFVSNNGLPPSVHIADLDGESGKFFQYFWYAAVDILVVDQNEQGVENARVDISWSDGSVDRCVTRTEGWCSVLGYQFRRTPSLTLTVTDVSNTGLPYEPSLNHDPDGDSDGTRITVYKP